MNKHFRAQMQFSIKSHVDSTTTETVIDRCSVLLGTLQSYLLDSGSIDLLIDRIQEDVTALFASL